LPRKRPLLALKNVAKRNVVPANIFWKQKQQTSIDLKNSKLLKSINILNVEAVI
jgi:hypothetical protein